MAKLISMRLLCVNREGTTRIVFVSTTRVFKVPNFMSGWRLFLCGLLANMQERQFGALGWDELCPVFWSIPGGWLVVMPRARVMSDAEFASFDVTEFCEREDYVVPAEHKSNSFGFLENRIVAIDYGN
jgi:hypothetical protein